ncbi:MAG: malate dehydrogenase [Desulfurococcales archaeon]|nr:malate dehydrogenase [Desulfurococcales archaeon]MCE4605627.1 malate dehydrogenase [Desulfurococcales archaeon]
MITIIGSGRVGTSAANYMMLKELDDILLIDIIEGRPQGEALDLGHAAAILGLSVRVKGTNDYKEMEGSDLVIVTAGFPRKPSMTREELLAKNSGIIKEVARNIKKYAPESVVILTTNPVDAMTYVMYKELGWNRSRVIGFSGVLDAGRLAYYASLKLGISPASIVPIVLGMHGQKMYPVPRLSTVGGAPLTTLLSEDEIQEIVKETVESGARITELRGYSSSFGPGAGLALMAEAVKKGYNKVFIASVVLNGEYGFSDIVGEVPIILGAGGMKRVIELPLDEEERRGLEESLMSVKSMIDSLREQGLA